jgi:hypothetical protein
MQIILIVSEKCSSVHCHLVTIRLKNTAEHICTFPNLKLTMFLQSHKKKSTLSRSSHIGGDLLAS